MNSILPSRQTLCPSCDAYNPPGTTLCEVCGTKRDVPRNPDRGLLSSRLHFILGFGLIVVGTAGFSGNYPPGRIISVRGSPYTTTEWDVLLFGILPLTFGVLYLLFAVALRLKERFFG